MTTIAAICTSLVWHFEMCFKYDIEKSVTVQDAVHCYHLREHSVWNTIFLFTEQRGGVCWEVTQRSYHRGSPLGNNKEKEAIRPGRREEQTKPTSFPESPRVQPIKWLILIWLMIWILQVWPFFNNSALRGPQNYEPSQLTSDKQTRVTQMSSGSEQMSCGIPVALLSEIQHDAGLHESKMMSSLWFKTQHIYHSRSYFIICEAYWRSFLI